FSEPGKTKVLGVIADPQGKPQPARPFVVEAFHTEYVTHRKRLIGGFYSYDSKTVVTKIGTVCKGQTDELGRFKCEAKNLPAGSTRLQAKATDTSVHSTYAVVGVEVFEAGADSWWVPSDSDRIDLIPEKTRFEPDEKAKIVVRSPFPVATVLLTVE